jgi:EmrB/QacA subfamily drug resistance transporter
VLAVCCLAQFMVVLDISIVNVALPAMRTSLHLSVSGLQWVVNAYTLAFAGLLLFGGRAADLFGRKRVFQFGLALFTLASLLGGFAQNGTMILVARGVQGLGGAVLAPATLTLLMTSFTDPAERTRAMGLWGATAAGGGAVGAVLGGVLTDLVSWRWVLFVNVPIGVALFLASTAVLVESKGQISRIRDLDIPGTLTVTGGLVALAYGIVGTETRAWTSPVTLAWVGGGAVLLAVFLAVEAVSPAPLVPLGIFRRRALSTGNALAFVTGAAMFGMFFFISLYLQQVLGFSPLTAGLSFLPVTVGIIIGAQIGTRTVAKVGLRWLAFTGTIFFAAGLAWLSRLSPDGSFLGNVFGPSILMGLGLGAIMPSMVLAAISGVPPQQSGLASGLVNTSRQIGAALGLAVLTTIATHRSDALARAGETAGAAATSGYARALLIASAIALVGALLALLLPVRPAPASAPAAGGPATTDADGPEAELLALEAASEIV